MKSVHVVASAIEAVASTSHTCLKVMLPQRRRGGGGVAAAARRRQRRHCVQASHNAGAAAERVQRVHLHP